jgi:hypothetical protein
MLTGEYCSGCPADEVCSPSTPEGLRFLGPRYLDDITFFPDETAKPIAVGGTQTITIEGVGDFKAEVDGPELEVVEVAPPRVTVRAKTIGAARLRIVDEYGLLYDRVSLAGYKVDRIETGPPLPIFEYSEKDLSPYALLRGKPAFLFVRLFSENIRVVDQSMFAEGTNTSTTPVWDVVTVEGGTSFKLHLGDGQRFTPSAPVVDAVDWIDQLDQGIGIKPTMIRPSETSAPLCFVALAEDRTTIVLGAEFRVEGPPSVRLKEYELPGNKCWVVLDAPVGPATLTVWAGDLGRDFTFEILPEN